MSMWLTAAGFVHLIENYGDPPLFNNNQESKIVKRFSRNQ